MMVMIAAIEEMAESSGVTTLCLKEMIDCALMGPERLTAEFEAHYA